MYDDCKLKKEQMTPAVIINMMNTERVSNTNILQRRKLYIMRSRIFHQVYILRNKHV